MLNFVITAILKYFLNSKAHKKCRFQWNIELFGCNKDNITRIKESLKNFKLFKYHKKNFSWSKLSSLLSQMKNTA